MTSAPEDTSSTRATRPKATPPTIPIHGPLLSASRRIGTIDPSVIEPPCGRVKTLIKYNAPERATITIVSVRILRRSVSLLGLKANGFVADSLASPDRSFIQFFLTRRRIGPEKKIFVSSLRRYYPDQVQRVDGDEAIISAGSYPSSPLRNADLNPLFKNWPSNAEARLLRGFFEEVARPIGPAPFLRSWAEVGFKLHPDVQILEPSSADDTGNPDSFRHFHNSDGVRCHMFELWR